MSLKKVGRIFRAVLEYTQISMASTVDSAPKPIVVFGATGQQGGSVARAIHKDPTFKVRAVTRNAESDKAQILKQAGMDVVEADMLDVSSLGEVVDGAYGVFLVTTAGVDINGEREIQQGINVANACRGRNIKHMIFSSAGMGRDLIDKACPLADNKAEVESHIKQIGLPLTAVYYGFYYENLLDFVKPQKSEDGTYTIGMPMERKPLSMVPAFESGECIREVFRDSQTYVGKTRALVAQRLTVEEMAEILNAHLEGIHVKASKVTAKEYSELNFPGAYAIGSLYEYLQNMSIEQPTRMPPILPHAMSDFETWVKTNKHLILSAVE